MSFLLTFEQTLYLKFKKYNKMWSCKTVATELKITCEINSLMVQQCSIGINLSVYKLGNDTMIPVFLMLLILSEVGVYSLHLTHSYFSHCIAKGRFFLHVKIISLHPASSQKCPLVGRHPSAMPLCIYLHVFYDSGKD